MACSIRESKRPLDHRRSGVLGRFRGRSARSLARLPEYHWLSKFQQALPEAMALEMVGTICWMWRGAGLAHGCGGMAFDRPIGTVCLDTPVGLVSSSHKLGAGDALRDRLAQHAPAELRPRPSLSAVAGTPMRRSARRVHQQQHRQAQANNANA